MGGLLDTADFSAVVSDIYEASLSPAQWDLALTGLVSRFGPARWDVAMLVWERLDPGGGRFVASAGVNEMARTVYLQHFAGRNEWSARGHHLPVGSVVHSDRLISREEFRQTPFSKEFLALFGMEVGLIGSLDKHTSDHLGLCMPGPDSAPLDRLEEAVGLILPHIQRSVRIARRIGEAELSAAHSTAALDRAPSPVILLTERFELAFANAAGHRLIADYRLENGGRIRLGPAALHDDLARLLDPAGAAHCRPLRIAQGAPNELAAMAMRVNPDRIAGAHTGQGVARLMVVAAHNPAVSEEHIDRLRDWFALTHAEARLASLLADGGSTEDYCQLRGVSANATRFLLKGIFAKTGVNRQAQLVRLISNAPLHWNRELPTGDLPSPI